MIHAVTYDLRPQYEDLLEQMFRARHHLYVEGRKWRELAKADGREIDQFDTESAIYFLAIGKHGELQGGMRLVPSTQPHMLRTVFPELCTRQPLPNSSRIWELSRVFVCHNKRHDEDGLLLKGKLMCGMMEFALANGINEILGVSDSYFLPRLLEIGLNVFPLGMPKPYETGEMLAFKFDMDEAALRMSRDYYQIPAGVLRGVPEQPAAAVPATYEETFTIETAFHDIQSEYVDEFAAIIPMLSSGDPSMVAEGERQLDNLAQRVRSSVAGGHSLSGSGGALN